VGPRWWRPKQKLPGRGLGHSTPMEAVIFVGIQGSGKSSFNRQQFFDTHVRISLDVLRTRHREQLLFAACLAAKQPFGGRQYQSLLRDRARYIEAARKAGFRVVAYFFSKALWRMPSGATTSAAESRNSSSGNRGTMRKLQVPTLEEGYNEIHKVTLSPEGCFVVRKVRCGTHRMPGNRGGTRVLDCREASRKGLE